MMNGRTALLSRLVVAGTLGVVALALVAGCRKERPAGSASGQEKARPAHQQGATSGPQVNTDSARLMSPQEQTGAVQPAAQAAGEQTTCPVMGGPIDKSIFVEYKGKKVYFCCNGCVASFQQEPEKYVAKLPQFAP
jgi:YHS domain-containing protein